MESQRVHHQMEEELSKVKQVSHTSVRLLHVLTADVDVEGMYLPTISVSCT